VYFPDALAAATAFVERLADAASPMEWFWDSVFEGQVPPGDPEAGVRFALDRLLELPGGPVRIALLVDALRARGTADRFLSWLRPTDGERLLGVFGLDVAPHRRSAASMAPAGATGAEAAELTSEPEREVLPVVSLALRAWQPVLAAWTARWGESDPRSRWLAAVALLSAQPSILVHAELRVLAGRVLRAARPAGPERPAPELAPHPRGADTKDAVVVPKRSSRSSRAKPSASPRRRSESAVVHQADAGEARAVQSPEHTARSSDWDLHATAAAGLLLVVPLLSRLGMAEVLALNSVLVEMDFPLRLLLFIADRVRVPKADAVRAALEPAGPRLPLDDRDRVLSSWLTRVRRALHWQARMGLRALVARPGQIAATRTHIDIVLPLDRLDIRVRRAGLDADPGWVPWLGRVVTFHYEAEP
jgi:hypothetical protein